MQNDSSKDQQKAIIEVLKVLADQAAFSDKKEELDKLRTLVDHNNKALVEIYQKQLRDMWQNYKDPDMDYDQVVADYERVRIGFRDVEQRRKENQGTPIEDYKDDKSGEYIRSLRDFHELIINKEDAYYPICPGTGLVKTEPIKYFKILEWKNFESKVLMKNPYTKSLDLHRTLKKIMEEGKRRGLTTQQVMDLIRMLLKIEIPSLWNSVVYVNDPRDFFDIVMNSVDYPGHLGRLRNALKSIQRKPDESVNAAIRAYGSIVQELLQIQIPEQEDDTNRKQAAAQQIAAIKYFVSTEVNNEIKIYKELYYKKHKEKVGLEDLLKFVAELEMNPHLRPKSTQSLASNNIKIDLYLTSQGGAYKSFQLGTPMDKIKIGREGDLDKKMQRLYMTEDPGSTPDLPNSTSGSESGDDTMLGGDHIYDNMLNDTENTFTEDDYESSHDATFPSSEELAVTETRRQGRSGGPVSTQPLYQVFNQPGVADNRRRGSSASRRNPKGASGGRSRPASGDRSRNPSGERPSRNKNKYPAYSPSSGRRRFYVASPGGKSAQPLPRDNIMEVRDGRLRRRPVSRSATPARSPNRCKVCWRRKDPKETHHCEYGKISAKVNCSKCRRGFHPPSVCRTRSTSRSASAPNRNKSRSQSRSKSRDNTKSSQGSTSTFNKKKPNLN